MTENFEGGPKGPEKPREYSAEDVQEIHRLAIKVRNLVGWDLGSMCTTTEECEMVNDTKDAMKEIESMFAIPEQQYWHSGAKTKEASPIARQQLSVESFTKVQENLAKIENVLGWDIEASCHDETDLKVVKNAKQAFEELKKMLK